MSAAPGARGVLTYRGTNPDLARDFLEDMWTEVARLGGAEQQLLIILSNAFLSLADPSHGVAISYRSYAERRGIDRSRIGKRGAKARSRFNGMVARLASIEVVADYARERGDLGQVNGRLILPERIGRHVQGPLGNLAASQIVDVEQWRIVPGLAWLAAKDFGDIATYPAGLARLAPGPRKHDRPIGLGTYLCTHDRRRRRAACFDEPVKARDLLTALHEEFPEDRRRRLERQMQIEAALDRLVDFEVIDCWGWMPGRSTDDWWDGLLTYRIRQGEVPTSTWTPEQASESGGLLGERVGPRRVTAVTTVRM